MFKLAAILSTMSIASVSSFVPIATNKVTGAGPIRSTNTQDQDQDQQEEPEIVAPIVAPINGWVPSASLPLYGLPGAVAPLGYFDPMGFSQEGITLNEVKRYREAEVMHGRVAMLAVVGYFVGEGFGGPFGLVGPANDQLQQVPLPAFALLTASIAAIELNRARIGWVNPEFGAGAMWTLRDSYYPGDVGFDPLGLKPTEPAAFKNMQTKELQNGRLAMIAIAGICAQELVNHRTIFETFEYFSKVYGGENPYAACGEGMAAIC